LTHAPLAEVAMKALPLVVILALLAGCAAPVTVQNPHNGQTVTCGSSTWELNPWSQHDACVAGYLAQGWTIAAGR
jgi:hypothetical protein